MSDDRIEHIKDLQKNPYKAQKTQSIVINNFFSLITIIVVCISIIFYTAYIVPAQEAKAKRELMLKKKQEYYEMRKRQIALSHKMNNPDKQKDDNTTNK